MNKHARRLIAAEKLERLAWTLVRYAQRVKRATENPSAEHERSCRDTYARAKRGIAEFVQARRECLKP